MGQEGNPGVQLVEYKLMQLLCKNSVDIPQKMKNRNSIQFSYPTLAEYKNAKFEEVNVSPCSSYSLQYVHTQQNSTQLFKKLQCACFAMLDNLDSNPGPSTLAEALVLWCLSPIPIYLFLS